MTDTTKVWRSLIVFLAALLLVYVIFFDFWSAKSVLTQAQIQNIDNIDNVVDEPISDAIIVDTNNSIDSEINTANTEMLVDWKNFYSTQRLFSNWDSANKDSIADFSLVWQQNKILLGDTHERNWTMQLLDILKLQDNARYILKDNNNTHYVFLGFWDEDISDLVTFLWWEYLDISDQLIIQDSQEFWVRVQRIVLPSYKNNLKDISIFTLSSWESWLIQMDNNVLNKSLMKIEIKERFDEFYSI